MNSLKFIFALGCMALLTIHQIGANQETCKAVIEDVISVFKEQSEDGGCFKKSLEVFELDPKYWEQWDVVKDIMV
ncbi:hypothetical protein X975_02328, partial [Stegodyphus mimosarum]